MLVLLGFLMILVFMTLIMTKKLSPILALIIVPTVFGLFAGAGLGIGDMVMDAIKSMSSTAALLMFAIIYFGVMIDVGLFDKLVELIIKGVGNDPAKVVIGTAILAGCVSLDGDGSTTFIVVTAAMLPVYQRLGMSPVVLTCVAGLTNGTLNIVPWGGPTARAATALHVDANSIFTPMVPALVAGLAVVLLFAWRLGVMERRRIRAEGIGPWQSEVVGGSFDTDRTPGPATQALTINHANTHEGEAAASSFVGTALDPNRPSLRPKLFWFNLLLTVTIMVLLVMDILPLPYLFMVGAAIALLVNFRTIKEQGEELAAHSSAVISVVAMVMAAGVLTGVMSGTGMVDAMAQWLVQVIPESWGPYLAVVTGVLSIPMTFFMSNDAFYYGILPVLTETASHYGIPAVDMARASITGQPVHLNSPLVPAILLLVSLAGVELGDHHKKVLWRATVVSLVMLATGVLTGVIMMG